MTSLKTFLRGAKLAPGWLLMRRISRCKIIPKISDTPIWTLHPLSPGMSPWLRWSLSRELFWMSSNRPVWLHQDAIKRVGIHEAVDGRCRPDRSMRERHQLSHLINELQDIFSWSEYDLGQTGIMKHTIDTVDPRSIKQALCRHLPLYQQTIKEQTMEMMKQDLIEPSCREWVSDIMLVKKTGELHFCIDYRMLNEATKKDANHLLWIDEYPRHNEWNTLIPHIRYAFGLSPGAARPGQTTFISHEGTFRFKVMPFGLCNSPATF